jgi:hypothetical protein
MIQIVGGPLNGSYAGSWEVVASVSATSFYIQPTPGSAFVDETISPDNCFIFPAALPIAVIREGDFQANVLGYYGPPNPKGTIDVAFIANVSSANQDNPAAAMVEKNSNCQTFASAIITMAGTDSSDGATAYMPLRGMTTVVEPQWIDRSEQTDSTIRFERYQAVYRFDWGLQ